MKLTTLFRLRKPDGTDPVNIEDFNDNFDVIDEELGKRLESTGAASDMTVAFEQASARTNLKTGEKISVSFGKIMKWFPDLGTAAFQSVANNLTTTVAGSLLDARQGKILNDKYNQLNSELNERTTGKLMELDVTNVKANGVDVEFYRTGGMVHGNAYVAANQELPSGNDHILVKVNILPLHEFTFAMVDAYGNSWLAKFLTDGSISLSNYTGTAISTGTRLYSVGLTFAGN
mgnify:FL=1